MKFKDIQIEALSVRERELSGGATEIKTNLAVFVNKAIDADKRARCFCVFFFLLSCSVIKLLDSNVFRFFYVPFDVACR